MIPEALKAARDFIMAADNSTGCCMCGMAVEHHGLGDGHGPVDSGEYQANMIVEQIDTALAALSAPQHPDDIAVDEFAKRMKAKLALAREKGRGGWDDPTKCSIGYLSVLLEDHVQKADPVDVANIAMMISMRGAEIADERERYKAHVAYERYGHTGPWDNAPAPPENPVVEMPSL